MHALVNPRRASSLTLGTSLALVLILASSLRAAAMPPGWSTPKRVFAYAGAPLHSMVTDGGKIQIATERGGNGIWYVTNASGSWETCQMSMGNDRQPSIAVGGGAVHVVFARHDAGQQRIYTASSNQPAAAAGCGWALTKRSGAKASRPSMAAYGEILSIAFQNSFRKLKFIKGAASNPSWTIKEDIDSRCCTSAPSLALATNGSARVAYGDGTVRAQGLKYAARSGGKWRRSRASSGRVVFVDMVLDKSPGVFTKPSNAPKIVYVVKKRGTYLATKAGTFAGGTWGNRYFGRYFGAAAVTHSSNVTKLVYGGGGRLIYVRMSGAIWQPLVFSNSGKDIRPQMHAGVVTFSRKAGSRGIYFTAG